MNYLEVLEVLCYIMKAINDMCKISLKIVFEVLKQLTSVQMFVLVVQAVWEREG